VPLATAPQTPLSSGLQATRDLRSSVASTLASIVTNLSFIKQGGRKQIEELHLMHANTCGINVHMSNFTGICAFLNQSLPNSSYVWCFAKFKRRGYAIVTCGFVQFSAVYVQFSAVYVQFSAVYV
jgi:hypothetical protein